MKTKAPVEKNEIYDIDITGMGSEGEGVGRIEGFTVFVPLAIEGESIRARIVKVNKNFAFGRLEEILKPSSERTEPECSIYKRCGGCQLQHMSYEGQLRFKRQKVEDSIKRIGGLKDIHVFDVIGMDSPYRYRNKVQLPIGLREGKAVIGFYAQRTHEIINVDACLIQNEEADAAAEIVRNFIDEHHIEVYSETEDKGSLRHLMIRKSFRTGDVMAVIVSNTDSFPFMDELTEKLRSGIKGVKSIILNVNKGRTNAVLGKKCITLWGDDHLTDYIGDFRFSISPLAFFQVNPVQTEILYKKALEYANLTGEETVFDAYCGTGTISLFLAQKAKKVYGVEIIPEAIDNAKKNAEHNSITNAEFITGESEKVIPELIKKGIHAEVVVVDPPRKGCDRTLLEAIAQMQPSRIVYVSCDPATLARDLGILDTLGYKTQQVQPVDMFPETGHVECVTMLTWSFNP